MRVVYTPVFSDNPYQALLYRQLAKDESLQLVPSGPCFLCKVLRKRTDIVHFHWLHPFFIGKTPIRGYLSLLLFLCQWVVLRALHVDVVWTVHNLHDHEYRQPRCERLVTWLVSRAARAVIVHCETAGDLLRSTCPWIQPEQVHIVPHASYSDLCVTEINRSAARSEIGLPVDATVVLFFGEIRPYKGVPELLEAFKSCCNTDSKILLVAGRVHGDELRHSLQRSADGSSNIRLCLEFVDDHEIPTYMAAADVVAMPFREILSSGSVMLALSFGKPVIAPLIGCIADLSQQAKGFFYRADDEKGLENALAAAISHAGELKSLGEANREMASAMGWDKVARETRSLYQSLDSAGRRTTG